MSENLYRSANLRSFDSNSNEKRLKFCIVSNDNACERFDWEMGRYTEILDPKGARFDNLKTMFKDHLVSVDSAIARVENIRLENDELMCECVFDEGSKHIYERFKSRILNDVSIGYRVLDSEVSKKDGKKLVLVKSFEILELSAVWKGADKNATIRSKEDELQKARDFIKMQKLRLNLKQKELR